MARGSSSRQNPGATTETEDSLAIGGRHLTRMVDMFWDTTEVLALAKKLHLGSDEEALTFKESASDDQKRTLALVDKINDLESTLIEQLAQPGANARAANANARTQLRIGQSNGKSEDMRKVRELIGRWRKWDPPFPDVAERGLNHVQCAFLLAPTTVDWANEDARARFITYEDPPMNPSDWPNFFWPEGKYNADDPFEGVLQGELLFKAAKAILFSPASSLGELSETAPPARGARGSTSRRGGLIGIAKAYNLTGVNTPFISYVAVVVRHGLTSDGDFAEVCSGFDYRDFYNQIREFLDSPKFAEVSAKVATAWNERLFCNYHVGGGAGPSEQRKQGTLAFLESRLPRNAPQPEPEAAAWGQS